MFSFRLHGNLGITLKYRSTYIVLSVYKTELRLHSDVDA